MDIQGNFDELLKKWREREQAYQQNLRRATQKAAEYAHSQVPPYPSAPVTSTYTRTGLLGRSITTSVKEIGTRYVGVIGTKVVYAPYVISDKAVGGAGPQTAVHKKTGWYTLQGVVRAAREGIMTIYRGVLNELTK